MAENCQNCNEIITASFCGNCGQKKYKRIDRKYVSDEIQYTFLHTNKGFLYSVKNIIKNPGKTARDFIDGNRVNHYKPILLGFVLSGISAFISFKIIGLSKVISELYASDKRLNSQAMNDYMTVTNSYNSIIMLMLIPFFALCSKLAFRKWGHNYYEHVVMNAFVLCFYTLFNIIIIYPIMYFLKDNPSSIIFFSGISMLLSPLMLVWFFNEFYKGKKVISIIGRVALLILYSIIGFIILTIFAGAVGLVVAMMKGPEAMEYIKPR